MNFFKKTTLALTTFILFVIGIAYYTGLFSPYLQTEQQAQTQKPYTVQKLDYLSSFIIPSIEEEGDFNKLLEAEPTAAVANLSAITTSITQEALNSFLAPQEHPLPLLAHFNTGDIGTDEGMTPEYMISLIEEGHHILPSWKLEPYWKQQLPDEYYMNSILRAKELNLPLTFVIDPIEKTLSDDSYYFTLSESENPNVIDTNGNTLEQLSPLGPDSLWSEIGQNFANTALMQRIQEWYPNPPLVMFVDTSNTPKLNWAELESSQRFINRYGNTTDDNFQRTVIGAQWIEKYRLMHEGVKNSFTSDTWKTNTKFIAYNLIALNIGITSNWKANATLTNQQFSSWPLTTDGINVEYFTDASTSSINENIFNKNNIPFVLQEAYKHNSGFSYQLSVADFDTFDTSNKYRGFTQLGLWLTRPNIVREFNNETNDKNIITAHFQSVIDSIELIHNDDRLQNFWKNGKLVANPTASIEQLLDVPSYYADADKWFLLDVDINPAPEWTLDTHLPVYAIALETGVAPNREWLLLAQSFDGDQKDVSVSIPGYQDVLVNASESGNLYLIGESAQEQVVAINNSMISNTTEPTNILITNEDDFLVEQQSRYFTSSNIQGNGPKYYVDPANGNDKNSGDSQSTPWKSLANLKKHTFTEGSSVLIKRGTTLDSSIDLTSDLSGSNQNPFTLGAYGEGNRPVINVVSDQKVIWEEYDDSTWKTQSIKEHPTRIGQNNSELLRANMISELNNSTCSWFYDNNSILYIKSKYKPIDYIRKSMHGKGIFIYQAKNINIQDIEIIGGYDASIAISESSNIKLFNVVVGKYATNGIKITNSNFIEIAFSNIDANFAFDYSDADAYIGSTNRGPENGIYITKNSSNIIINNNIFKNWNHASIDIYANLEDINNEVSYVFIKNNFFTSPDITYGGRIGVDGNSHNNEISYNVFKNISVGNQINGHDNHFHTNIIDYVNDSPLKNDVIGKGIALEGYAGEVYNNIIEKNIIAHTDSEGIYVSRMNKYSVHDNIIRNNILFNCGMNIDNISIVIGRYNSGDGSAYANEFNHNIIYADKTLKTIIQNGLTMDVSNFNGMFQDTANASYNIAQNPNFLNQENVNFQFIENSIAFKILK